MKKLMALFLLLGLVACGDDDTSRSDPEIWRGFYLSVNAEHEIGCFSESNSVYLEGEEQETYRQIHILAETPRFPELPYFGIQTTRSGVKTLTGYYRLETDDGVPLSGTMHLVSKTDDTLGEIFTGYWAGHASRPAGNPLVMCPYVMVPHGVLDENACGESPDGINPALAPYLAVAGGYGDCFRVLNNAGRLIAEDVGE